MVGYPVGLVDVATAGNIVGTHDATGYVDGHIVGNKLGCNLRKRVGIKDR